MITIRQHSSPNYAPRTRSNATIADVTVTFACDPTTPGEKLTHKSAGNKHIGFVLTNLSDARLMAGALLNFMEYHNCACLNIAGNGIFTLSKHGWTQERVDHLVADIIRRVVRHYVREFSIVTGGQTGVDLAGARAAMYCGLDAVVTLPCGYVQRGADGVDSVHTREEIEAQVETGAVAIILDELIVDDSENLTLRIIVDL